MSWTPKTIRELRIGLGWSAAQLSRRLGLKVKEVMSWEAGESEPGPSALRELDNLRFLRDDCNRHTSEAPQADESIRANNLEQITRKELTESSED